MSFLGKIQNGNVDLQTPYNRLRFKAFLGKNEGRYVRIELIKNTRSLKQNSYYWVCLETIANHTGNSPEELHRIFKKLFLHPQTVKYRGRVIENEPSTIGLTKGEFVEYMMNIEREAGEMGVILPDPKDFGPELL